MTTLATPRLDLRELGPGEFDDLAAMYTDDDVMRFLPVEG